MFDVLGLVPLSIRLGGSPGRQVVHLSGELDVAGRTNVVDACAGITDDRVVVDLSELVFMDCAGYGGLVAARLVAESRGGSLTVLGRTGEPERLLTLIAATEQRDMAGRS